MQDLILGLTTSRVFVSGDANKSTFARCHLSYTIHILAYVIEKARVEWLHRIVKNYFKTLPHQHTLVFTRGVVNSGFLAVLLFLLFPTFLQLSYFSYFLLKIA
jgi:hypothetical protein